MIRPTFSAALAAVAAVSPSVWAGGVPTTVIEEVVVTGRLNQLRGSPSSASQGIVGEEQLGMRPVLRTGELLEVVPGLIVTQHSGDGKANQYFLRGFNLDHGTDLATSVDGVPVNMPTHGHGQGYTDINFVIPELVQSIEYRKGTYYAETGNFSAAGAVDMRYRRALDAPLLVFEAGEDSYARALIAGSSQLGGGTMLMGFDYANIDGPWQLRGKLSQAQRLAALQPRDRRRITHGHGTRLRRRLAFDRSNPTARRAVRADRSLRRGGPYRRRQLTSLQPVR